MPFLALCVGITNWQWSDSDFKNFAGSLYGVIEALYDSRRQEFVSFVVICVLFDI